MNERASHVFISKRTVEIGIPTNFKLQNSGVGGGGGGLRMLRSGGESLLGRGQFFRGVEVRTLEDTMCCFPFITGLKF